MKKSDELKKTINELKAQIEDLQQKEQFKDAAKLADELTDTIDNYKTELAKEQAELTDIMTGASAINKHYSVDDSAMRRRIFNKRLFGRSLNDEEIAFENAAGTPGQVGATPEKGGYLVPEEQIAQLREYRKAYTELKNLCHVQTANSTTGKMPTLGDESGKLTSFEELNAIKQSDFDFGQLTYTIKDYGDIIPVSNQLIADADVDIMSIIGQRFARKAVNTENAEILGLLSGLSATALTGYKNVIKALNVDLDPAYYANAKILTNQDGFEWLSELEDGQSRPLLIPDVTAPDTYRFRGKEIVVVSNNVMATTSKKVPFYIGSISDYVAFFQRKGVEVAVSDQFLFDKYATALRCVERFGVIADDKDAVKAYTVTIA